MCDACEGKTIDKVVGENRKYSSDTAHSTRYPSVELHYNPAPRYYKSGVKYAW